MPAYKRKKRHHCKNHPKINARGKCTTCGSWICKDCSLARKGQFFCKDTCDPAKKKSQLKPKSESKTSTKPNPKSKSQLHPQPQTKINQHAPLLKPTEKRETRPGGNKLISFLAGTTLALCGIVFGLIQFRQNQKLKEENIFLKERRMGLIETIKANNKEISDLFDEIHKLRTIMQDKFTKRKYKPLSFDNVQYFQPSSGLPFSFDNGDITKKIVTLTFDGGSHINAATDILDTLKSRDVKASMFLTGRFIRKYPQLVQRIITDGHEVGNHTYSHPHLTSWVDDRVHTTLPDVSAQKLAIELEKARTIFAKLTGQNFKPYWRAPYGEKNRQICRWAQRSGYLHIGWRQGRTWSQNLDSNDWVPDEETPGYHSPEEVFNKVIAMAKSEPYGVNGGIILMHLGTVRKEKEKQVHTILGKLIDELKQMGYCFVTITEQLRESNVDIEKLLGTQSKIEQTLVQQN